MEYKLGQFLPNVSQDKCVNCGTCIDVCPGIDVDPLNLRSLKNPHQATIGAYLECYTAYAKNFSIRVNSSSGGVVTNLLVELIKNKEFDVAFVLNFEKFNGQPARLSATDDPTKIVKSAKSKYIPASIYNIIKLIQKNSLKRCIIVGTPCQIYGIKKFLKRFNIPEKNLIFLGLFCDKTMNYNILKFFEDIYRKDNEKMLEFQFRKKSKNGWPGDTEVTFDSGRRLTLNRSIRIAAKPFFQLNRCLFCSDKLNRYADISFGDCYIEGKNSFSGKSEIVIRTNKGQQLFQKYSNLFNIEKEDIERIAESQDINAKRQNLEIHTSSTGSFKQRSKKAP